MYEHMTVLKYLEVISSVQLLSHIRLFATAWTEARQSSPSITNSRSLLKLMSIESVMPFNHLILCHPFLLSPSIFHSIRVFSNESTPRLGWPNYWSFSSLLRSFLIYSPLFLDAAFKITLTAPFFTIYFICQCLPLHCNVISMKEPTGNGVWYYWCWTLCSFPNAVWI